MNHQFCLESLIFENNGNEKEKETGPWYAQYVDSAQVLGKMEQCGQSLQFLCVCHGISLFPFPER